MGKEFGGIGRENKIEGGGRAEKEEREKEKQVGE